MGRKKTEPKKQKGGGLEGALTRKSSIEQEIARLENALESLRTEKGAADTALAQSQLRANEFRQKIQRNSEEVENVPAFARVNLELTQMQTKLRDLQKEKAFVEQKAAEVNARYQTMSSERMQKQDLIRQASYSKMRPNESGDPNRNEQIDAARRVLESDLQRSEGEFRRFDEEYRKFQSRLYDIETQIKRLKSDERYKEDEVVTARRSEIVEAENQHLLQEMEKFESEKRQREGDVEKLKKDIQRTQEKLKKHQADLAAVESDIIRLQRHQGKLD